MKQRTGIDDFAEGAQLSKAVAAGILDFLIEIAWMQLQLVRCILQCCVPVSYTHLNRFALLLFDRNTRVSERKM